MAEEPPPPAPPTPVPIPYPDWGTPAWMGITDAVPQAGAVEYPAPQVPPVSTVPPPPVVPPPAPPTQKFDRTGAEQGDEVPIGKLPVPPPPAEADTVSGGTSVQQALGGLATPSMGAPPTPAAPPVAPELAQESASPIAPDGRQVFTGAPGQTETEEAKSVGDEAAKLAQDPAELAKQDELAKGRARTQAATDAYWAAVRDNTAAQKDVEAKQKAAAAARAEQDAATKQATAISQEKFDPGHGVLRGIADVIALTLGGAVSQATGGRNLALEALNKRSDQEYETWKANQATRLRGVETQQRAADTHEQQADQDYRDATAFRMATYIRAMNMIQTKQQDFDPHGTQVRELAGQYQQIGGALQKQQQDFGQKTFDNRLKVEGAYQKQQEIDETRREHDLQYDEKMAKLKGGAGGGAGNTAYNTPTGIMSPYLDETGKPVPLMGTKSLDVKGHEKEFSAAQAQVGTYGHVQDYWADLARIGAKIDYDKSLGESIWSKRKSTDGAKYDSARHALVVYLTKELGDKLTQGQIDEQAQRIPERASLFEARDPGKQISDAQEAADRDFVRDMNVLGADARPIVAAAQRTRKPPTPPTPDESIAAAQSALAGAKTNDERKSAATQLDTAKEELRHRDQEQIEAKQAEQTVTGYYPHKAISTEGLPADLKVDVEARNKASETYNQELKAFHQLPAAPKIDPKMKGDAAKAEADHHALVQQRALRVVKARRALDAADNDATDRVIRAIGQHDFGGLPRDKIDLAARQLGMDPTKFGHDLDGQIAEGAFVSRVHNLTPAERSHLRKAFLGQ